MRIIIALNSSWNIINFRAGLIKSLISAGHDVIAAAPRDKYSEQIERLGCRYIELPMEPKGTSIFADLLLTWRLIKMIRSTQADCLLGFTIKPNIFGGIAAKICGIPCIPNIAGLGITFQKRSLFTRFLELLYRISFSSSSVVFFQNEEDRERFIGLNLIDRRRTDRIPGSGVDLERFKCTESPSDSSSSFRFLLMSRMLWSKGIAEYIAAAQSLRSRHPHAEFCLLGFLDVKNPDAIPSGKMSEWTTDSNVRYLGSTDRVEDEISKSHCVVLPSFYPEGVPRSLLESAAMGRPIITTDTTGCREVVADGVNGYLCEPRSAEDLAAKMAQVLALDAQALRTMGQESRKLVASNFDERLVFDKYLRAIASP